MNNKKILGVFALAMINVAAIVSLRNLPLMASYGLASIFFYAMAALTYFIPTALVSAEMATMLPQSGGPFRWVGEGLGPNWGFFAIWWSWMESIAWFPTILTFVGATTAYFFNPEWASNKAFILVIMLTIFWLGTFMNLFGMKISSRVSSIGVSVGTLLPGAIIIGLAVTWLFSGNESQLVLNSEQLLPRFDWDNMSFYVGLLLGLAGIEMAAFHAQDAQNPQKDYPKAIFLSALIIMALSIAGTLAISVVLPSDQLNIVEGLMQTIAQFLKIFGLEPWVPLFALFIVSGSLAGIATWIIGPAKGILASSELDFIPRWLQKTNAHGAPVSTLMVQAAIGTVLASAFALMPNIESAYWVLTVLSAQFALGMYILIFIAAVRLRYTQPNRPRPYRVPAIKWVCGLGILSCSFAFLIGFVPPQQLKTGELMVYELYLLSGLLLLSVPPAVLCYQRAKREGKIKRVSSAK